MTAGAKAGCVQAVLTGLSRYVKYDDVVDKPKIQELRIRSGTCQRWVYQVYCITHFARLIRSSRSRGAPLPCPRFLARPPSNILQSYLLSPETVGVSPFGVRGNIGKESELFLGDAGGDGLAGCDKGRPGVWGVRRHQWPHHVPKYVLLGGGMNFAHVNRS